MREYDDHIRLYTPVLQRVIILVTVIVAVPVVLWTITAFVRAYVAPPRPPSFQHIAAPTDSTAATQDAGTGAAAAMPPPQPIQPPAPPVAPPVAAADAKPVTIEARPRLLEIKKPSGDQPPTIGPATGIQPTPPQRTQPIAALPSPDSAPTAAPPPAAAVPPPAPPQALADKTDKSSAPASSDRGLAWPDPSAGLATPPNGTSGTPATAPAASPAPVPARSDVAAEALPARAPIAGPIPLPRPRPTLVAMVQTTGVPLPRARPVDAPGAPSVVNDAGSSNYEAGMDSGRY